MTEGQTPVTKAVIAAAGFGTRFLPQTKAMPKEMLPLVDKPVIQYVVEELVASGIKDIIIVTGYNKRSIEDHFDTPNQDLINNLTSSGKAAHLKEVEAIANLANFIYIRQKGLLGNATPVLNAAHLIGNEPFIYTYADDFFAATPSRTRQLIEVYEQNGGGSVLACKRVHDPKEYDRYGIVSGDPLSQQLLKVNRIIEKPGQDNAPSDLASVSGYLFTPDIFKYIEQAAGRVESGQELMIQSAIQAMIDDNLPVYACEIQDGKYYDTGNKLDYLKTVVEFALQHQELNNAFREYLRSILL
jgi:UTP--glucose-1-phosphate uridylyltransferase